MPFIITFIKTFFLALGVLYFVGFLFDKFGNLPINEGPSLFSFALIGGAMATFRQYAKEKKIAQGNTNS